MITWVNNMGRIVAIAGGTFQSTEAINKKALEITGSENPKVLFVPTAHRDDAKYIREFKVVFEGLGAEVRTLELTKNEYSDAEIDKLIAWMDMIYVGDGNAVYMMNTWRKYNLDKKLRAVFSSDHAVLAGNGAGCTCWFSCGYSNSQFYGGKSDWQYIWADEMLDFHHTAVCPHYTDEERANFDRRLLEKEIPGYALEDHVALVQVDQHTEFLACHPKAKAWYLIYLNGRLMKEEIHLNYI